MDEIHDIWYFLRKSLKNNRILSIAEIKEAVHDAIESTGDAVTVVYLFGSYAKETPTNESDIDLCVPDCTYEEGNYQFVYTLLNRLQKDIDLIFDDDVDKFDGVMQIYP